MDIYKYIFHHYADAHTEVQIFMRKYFVKNIIFIFFKHWSTTNIISRTRLRSLLLNIHEKRKYKFLRGCIELYS